MRTTLLAAVVLALASPLACAQSHTNPAATPLTRLIAPAPQAQKAAGKSHSAFGQAMAELTGTMTARTPSKPDDTPAVPAQADAPATTPSAVTSTASAGL